jgi:hypothetical protein
VLQRSHRAGQAGDDEHVALAEVGQGLVELGAGGELAGRGVGEDLVASVGGQVIDLAVSFWLRVDTRAYPIFAITRARPSGQAFR